MVEEADGGVQVVDHRQGDLGGLLPLPFLCQVGFREDIGARLDGEALGTHHLDRRRHPVPAGQEAFGSFQDMQTEAAPPASGGLECGEEARDQFGRPGPDDDADVEGVADLPVEGVEDDLPEPVRVGGDVGDHPGASSPVQADRGPRLSGDGAQLGHGGSGPPGDRQGEAAIGEQGPAC